MSEVIPEAAATTPMLRREDGLVSFDGERGPWMSILSPAEVLELGALAIKARAQHGND